MSKLDNVSLTDLEAAVTARKAQVAAVAQERKALLKRLAELDKLAGTSTTVLKELPPEAPKAVKPAAKAGKKPVAKAEVKVEAGTTRVTLASCIQKVLADAGAALPVAAITERVTTIYPSKSKNLGPAVAVALSKMDGVQRVARGVYGIAGSKQAVVAGVEVVTPND